MFLIYFCNQQDDLQSISDDKEGVMTEESRILPPEVSQNKGSENILSPRAPSTLSTSIPIRKRTLKKPYQKQKTCSRYITTISKLVSEKFFT